MKSDADSDTQDIPNNMIRARSHGKEPARRSDEEILADLNELDDPKYIEKFRQEMQAGTKERITADYVKNVIFEPARAMLRYELLPDAYDGND